MVNVVRTLLLLELPVAVSFWTYGKPITSWTSDSKINVSRLNVEPSGLCWLWLSRRPLSDCKRATYPPTPRAPTRSICKDLFWFRGHFLIIRLLTHSPCQCFYTSASCWRLLRQISTEHGFDLLHLSGCFIQDWFWVTKLMFFFVRVHDVLRCESWMARSDEGKFASIFERKSVKVMRNKLSFVDKARSLHTVISDLKNPE